MPQTSSRRPRLAWFLVASVVVLAAVRYSPWRITYNPTPSEPRGLYLAHTTGPISARRLHYGELVQFHYICPETPVTFKQGPLAGATALACLDAGVAPYADGSFFVKKVEGKPGDTVIGRAGCVSIRRRDGRTVSAGCVLRRAPDGKPVPFHARWGAHGTRIPRGMWYAGSTRVPQSYDSRYFGLVSTKQIVGTIRPLWLLGKKH